LAPSGPLLRRDPARGRRSQSWLLSGKGPWHLVQAEFGLKGKSWSPAETSAGYQKESLSPA
jgi:hypothetical protein